MKNFIRMAFASGLEKLDELRNDSYSKEWHQSLNASIPKLNEMLLYYESIGDTESYDKVFEILNSIASKIDTAQEKVGLEVYNRYDNFLSTEDSPTESSRVMETENGYLILI